MNETKRQRYENYLIRARANDWQDQVEHWENMLAQLEEENNAD